MRWTMEMVIRVRGGYTAVRKGRWNVDLDPLKGVSMLFVLETDPAERRDLAAEHPEMFEELKALYAQWDSSLPPRAWTNISPVFKK